MGFGLVLVDCLAGVMGSVLWEVGSWYVCWWVGSWCLEAGLPEVGWQAVDVGFLIGVRRTMFQTALESGSDTV